MSRRLAKWMLILSFCTLSDAAYAQTWEPFELNIFGGGSWYNENRFEISFPQSIVPVNGNFRLDHALRFGVRGGVYTHGHWSEEFFYSYEPNKMHIIRTTAPSSSLDQPIRVHNYGVTALYYFHEDESRSVRPFASVGIGGTLYQLTSETEAFLHDPSRGNLLAARNSNEVAFHYGLGIKMRANNWIGFRADIRGFVGPTPGFGLPDESPNPTTIVFPVSGAMNNGEATAGVIFYFGKHHY
jgi:hypothetical protein